MFNNEYLVKGLPTDNNRMWYMIGQMPNHASVTGIHRMPDDVWVKLKLSWFQYWEARRTINRLNKRFSKELHEDITIKRA